MIKIILDCHGGDHSPGANIEGAAAALAAKNELYLILTGDEAVISEELAKYNYDKSRVEIVNAPEPQREELKPTDVIRMQKENSLVRAITLLREDDSIGGMVSIGSTGVVLVGSTLRVGRIRGILRPAYCPILPTMKGGIVGVCDSGANVECSPEYLRQFAVMGSVYLKTLYGIEKPRVALLNVGTEENKGDELRQRTFELLKNETPGINFVGNMESRDLLSGKYDLIVCDGFSGNVLIKSTEGACLEMLKKLKNEMKGSLRNKIGALFMKKMLMQTKELMDYQNYGGSVMLGARKVVIKGHGSSKAKGIEKCIEQAYTMVERDFCASIEKNITENENV